MIGTATLKKNMAGKLKTKHVDGLRSGMHMKTIF